MIGNNLPEKGAGAHIDSVRIWVGHLLFVFSSQANPDELVKRLVRSRHPHLGIRGEMLAS